MIESNGVPLKEGVLETLKYLYSRQIPMAVATSSAREIAEKYLQIANIEPVSYTHLDVYKRQL